MSKYLKSEEQQLEKTALELQAHALKAGAQAVEICGTFLHKTKITLEKQDFHLASADDNYVFGVRTLVDGKQGFSSCNTLDSKELKEVAARSVQIAAVSPENPYISIDAGPNLSADTKLDLFDKELFQVSLQTQKEWARLLREEATRDKRFRLNEGSVDIVAGATIVSNSKGTLMRASENAAYWSLMGMGVDGNQITSFDYFQEMARNPAQVQEKLLLSTRDFCTQLMDGLNTGTAKSYKGLAAFSPRAVAHILLSGLSYHFNGRNVVEGSTRWTSQDLGKTVLHPDLTVQDLPWLSDRTGAALFDREGFPTTNTTILNKGVLSEFLLDSYAAKALGQTHSNAHAAGGPTSLPGVGAFCLNVAGGRQSREDLMAAAAAQQKEFLLIHRFSGNVDPITGDFSGVAKAAEWCVEGKPVHVAKEALISGNVFEVLSDGLFGISKERVIINSAEECPMLIADGVSVTGNQS
ncbi:MAG: TldD/PmbA family protein [Bdellovibrionaceae bacterium]|nr:TldD/PmbA family protein [Bdellovibrionales bacterium]MCB9254717.1 TldD/PmbA family protein [Pseudobdellovibrionaceae bacterium]